MVIEKSLALLIKNIYKVSINLALIPIIKVRIVFVEVTSEVFANKAPVPGFKHVVAIVWWVGEYKAILVGIVF